jgi:hypothetical protein
MRAAAAADRFGVHRLVEDPEEAELIVFVETSGAAGWYFEDVRRHPLHRRFPERCYLVSSSDRIVPFLPGVFASVERRWNWPAWTRSGGYLGVMERGQLRYRPEAEPRLLYSFVGSSAAHPVRRRVAALGGPEALVIDGSAEAAPPSPEEYERRYVESLRDSRFVLCPRGGGTSSFRLFEAMMMGRAPVVIADEWVPPEGLDWDRLCVRVPEAEVESIPALLAARAGEAAAIGERARRAWLDWFSPEAQFHRTVERCLDLARYEPKRRGPRSRAPYLQMARPFHAARWAKKRLVGRS